MIDPKTDRILINTRLKTVDPNSATLGSRPKDNAEPSRGAARQGRGCRRSCSSPLGERLGEGAMQEEIFALNPLT